MIGIVDSGIGGLSILQALWEQRPGEAVAYLSDNAHLPYGDASPDEIRGWCLALGRYLIDNHGCTVLVLACNSATAAAADAVRANLKIPVVAVEPPVKPAVEASRNRTIGVLATRGTAASPRLQALIASHAPDCRVLVEACPGLADAIEHHFPDPAPAVSLLRDKVHGLLANQADVIALGCTHYGLVSEQIRELANGRALIEDPSAGVARRIATLSPSPRPGQVHWMATGSTQSLARAVDVLHGPGASVLPLKWKQGSLEIDATD
jgi:glutamate racemase